MRGIKYLESLELTLIKRKEDIDGRPVVYTKPRSFFNGDVQIIINSGQIRPFLKFSHESIQDLVERLEDETSPWEVLSVDGHHLNIAAYQALAGSSYIKLPEELQNSRKGLINLKNEDQECFRWCHIRYLNPPQRNPQRITTEDRDS